MKGAVPFFLSFAILLLWSCSVPEKNMDLSDFTPKDHFFFIDSASLQQNDLLYELYQIIKAHPAPRPAFSQELSSGWQFGLGDPVNGLVVDYKAHPEWDTVVTLSHRLPYPNWPFWYEQTFLFPEEAYLYANGDDGVQCFINEKRQVPLYGDYFHLPSSSDSLKITLRVLNNAMAGGLRRAVLLTPDAFQSYMEKRKLHHLRQELMYFAFQQGLKLKTRERETFKEVFSGGDTTAMKALIAEYPPLKKPLFQAGPFEEKKEKSFSFTAWGDSQGGWRTFARLVRYMAERPDDFSIGLGDLVGHGVDEQQWLSFTQCLQPLLDRQPVFPIAGNHDYDGYYNDLDPILYKKYVFEEQNHPTYFSWTYRNVFFLALDPNEIFPLDIQSKQMQWMETQMNSSEWKEADWRFLLIHQPPYAQGWPGYHGDDFIRALVDSLAQSKNIDFVLSGHNHDYERLSKTYGDQYTHFLILGGAGGGLEPLDLSEHPKMDTVVKKHHYAHFKVTEQQVKIAVYGIDNQLFDELLVRKAGE